MRILNTHLSPFVCKKFWYPILLNNEYCISVLIVVQNLRQPIVIRHSQAMARSKNLLTSGLFRMTHCRKCREFARICRSAPQDRNHKKAAGAQPSRRAPRSHQLPSPHPTCPILSDTPRRNNMRHSPAPMAPTPIVIAFRSGGMSVSVFRAKQRPPNQRAANLARKVIGNLIS